MAFHGVFVYLPLSLTIGLFSSWSTRITALYMHSFVAYSHQIVTLSQFELYRDYKSMIVTSKISHIFAKLTFIFDIKLHRGTITSILGHKIYWSSIQSNTTLQTPFPSYGDPHSSTVIVTIYKLSGFITNLQLIERWARMFKWDKVKEGSLYYKKMKIHKY